MAATHFTAWLVNDPSALDTGCIDISVIEDQLIGDDADSDDSWASRGDAQFHAVTTVDATDGSINDAQDEAEDLMAEAGWRTIGTWTAVDNAFIATVERA